MRITNNYEPARIRSLLVKTVLSVLILIPSVAFIHYSFNILLADRFIRSEQSPEGYTKAINLTPSNASLWWQRGRLYHYSIQNVNLDQAVKDYRRALQLNPRLGRAWIDLSDALEQKGRYDLAEEAFTRAFEIQPYSPSVRWQAGNYFLRRGKLPEMYDCFKTACLYDPGKLGIAMDTAWKIDPDHAGILEKLIPDDFHSNLRYLNFLVAKNEPALAKRAWRRCLGDSIPPDIKFHPSATFGYIDLLLRAGRTEEALEVWDGALRKASTGLSDSRYRESGSFDAAAHTSNLVWNGSFENEIMRGGFDWSYPNVPDIRFQTDTSNRLKELKSLKVVFGNTNVSTGYLYQIVPVLEPGEYILDFFVKTDGLTTDQKPYIAVTGYPHADGVHARGGGFPATSDWTKLSVPFRVDPGCNAVRLSLQRDKSAKLDNRIKGSLWLDGFSIHPQPVSRRVL